MHQTLIEVYKDTLWSRIELYCKGLALKIYFIFPEVDCQSVVLRKIEIQRYKTFQKELRLNVSVKVTSILIIIMYYICHLLTVILKMFNVMKMPKHFLRQAIGLTRPAWAFS